MPGSESSDATARGSLVHRLATPEDGVDGAEELSHSIVALGPRSIEPVDRPVAARDEPVSAGCNVDDDLAANGVVHRCLRRRPLARDAQSGLYVASRKGDVHVAAL